MMTIRALRAQPVVSDDRAEADRYITRDNCRPFGTPLEQRTCLTFEQAGKRGAK